MGSVAPERWGEQDEDREQLEPAEQHAGRQHPLRGVRQRRERAARADHRAEAGADVGDRRRGAGRRGEKIEADDAEKIAELLGENDAAE